MPEVQGYVDEKGTEEQLVEFSTVEEAVALLDQWTTAYRRLEHDYSKIWYAYEHLTAINEHTDFLLGIALKYSQNGEASFVTELIAAMLPKSKFSDVD